MYRTEHEANVFGFSCVKPATISKSYDKKEASKGCNLFKMSGYALSLVVILAVIF